MSTSAMRAPMCALQFGRCSSSNRRRAITRASAAWPPSLPAATQGFNWQLQHLTKPLLSVQDGMGKLLGAFVPITLAMYLSHSLKMGLAKDIQVAVFRSSAQLVIIGLVLKLAFDGEGLLISSCLVLFMVEAALALGASPYQAVHHYVEHSVAQGMGPMVDSIKTAGLISLPGSMTGMLMGGSSPLEAVQMQLQVLYMVLGCASVSCTISSFLGWQMMFTKSQQLSID
eukprot:c21274_g1_i3 orf=410-1093(-)